MMKGYYYGYSTPMMNYVDSAIVTAIAATVAAVIGVILYFTFFSRKNEDRFHGLKGKVYNLMTFNRFYAEDLLKLLYIVLTCAVTVAGISNVILGSFLSGAALIIVANLALRLAFELVMMFIMFCRKTVSMDRKLGRIVNYYDDGYGEFGSEVEMSREEWEEEGADESCGGDCGSCSVEGCGTLEEEEIETIVYGIKKDQQ